MSAGIIAILAFIGLGVVLNHLSRQKDKAVAQYREKKSEKQIGKHITALADELRKELTDKGVAKDKVDARVTGWMFLQISLLKMYGPYQFYSVNAKEARARAGLIKQLYGLDERDDMKVHRDDVKWFGQFPRE